MQVYYGSDNVMDILEATLEAVRSEESVMVATVLSTSGSTPASAFSKMLVKDRCTKSIGTVGGGCVEGDVLREAKRLYEQRIAGIFTFHLTEDHPESGMLCGGSLEVLIEPVTKENDSLFVQLKALRNAGEDCLVATYLESNGHVRGKILLRATEPNAAGQVYHADRLKPLVPPVQAELQNALDAVASRFETRRVQCADGELILEPVTGRPALVIFGGGHVSKFVSRAAAMAGFRVTVVDDRKEFANPERFPEAEATLCVDFAAAFRHVTVKPSSYIVIVTRGHHSDEALLEEAVKTPAGFIGMIGSTRKVQKAYENLLARGVPLDTLSRVHAPIGIDIGAVTAEEIGISIVAQLICVHRGMSPPLKPKSEGMKPLLSEFERKQAPREES